MNEICENIIYKIISFNCIFCNTEFKMQDANEVKEVRFKDNQRTENRYLYTRNVESITRRVDTTTKNNKRRISIN